MNLPKKNKPDTKEEIQAKNAAYSKGHRDRVRVSSSRMMQFLADENSILTLEQYKAAGYKKQDIINYALTLLEHSDLNQPKED